MSPLGWVAVAALALNALILGLGLLGARNSRRHAHRSP